ncbi:MAG: hypothetical protein K2J77_02855 [Oscillospiraceae bacterium]|nr:hypothetical protein [Oscillospiraceae bacterium]
MIITVEEFKELGFECAEADEDRLESCIKRAEAALNALSRGTLNSAMAQCESNAFMIKQAAAFEADALLKSELSEQTENVERVSLGDFSYSCSNSGGSQGGVIDVPETVRKLLCAAGCFYGAGSLEVIE